jgi:hypothetical protein
MGLKVSTDEPELDDTAGAAGGGSPPKPRRGRPPGSKTGTGTRGRPPKQRIERRSAKAAEALRELVRLRMPDLDVSDKTFAETVDRDAAAWGDFLAQLGEWVPPFGEFLDLVAGAALVRVLRIAPSLRAGRRDLRARAEARRAERERQLAAVAGYEDGEPVEVAAGVFVNPDHVEAPAAAPELTREEWLANGGAGERPDAGFVPFTGGGQ